MTKLKVNGAIHYVGVWFDLLNTWSVIFNFTYTVIDCSSHVRCKRGHFLGERINGTWHGLTGLLSRGEADLAAHAFIYYHSDWDEVADYLFPLYESELSIMVHSDGQEAVERRLSLNQHNKWRTWLLIVAFGSIVLIAQRISAVLRIRTLLHLHIADTLLMIGYRKFIAQCKTPQN